MLSLRTSSCQVSVTNFSCFSVCRDFKPRYVKIWQTLKRLFVIPQTSTHPHSTATHAHTSSHSALFPYNSPLWAHPHFPRNPSARVSHEKLPHQSFNLGNVSFCCRSSCSSCSIAHPDWTRSPPPETNRGTSAEPWCKAPWVINDLICGAFQKRDVT